MTIAPVEAISAAVPAELALAGGPAMPTRAPAVSFEQLLTGGIEAVDQKLQAADGMAAAFAVDDSIPLHQVMFAMEDARLAFELMLQVRARLVEGYQEIMRMQL